MNDHFDAAIRAWQDLLGAPQVLLGSAALAAFGQDTGGMQRRIPAALRIVAEDGVDAAERVAAVMRIAHRHRVAVHPISTGKNWGYGSALAARHDSVIIDLSGLAAITHFDAELGVVTVQPGVTQGMLAAFLDAGGHDFMVPVTGAGPTVSLMGNALERGYGVTPHSDHFGAVTDLEAVLPDGSLYRTALREAGGADAARLFKWGIGPHSAGLFSQSGFGIVTTMSIVLARRPDTIKVCLFSLDDDAKLDAAVGAIRRILSTLPGTVGGLNLMNRHRVLAMSAPHPGGELDSDGLIPAERIATLGRQYQVLPWTGFGTLYGCRRVVAAAQKEIRAELRGIASRLLFLSPANARLLARVAGHLPGAGGQRLASTAATLARSLELASGRPNETALPLAYWRNPRAPRGAFRDPARDGCGLLWYAPLVPMRAADTGAYVAMVRAVTRRHGIEPLLTFTSLNDRLFDSTVPLLFERDDPRAVAAAHACYADLLETGRRHGWFPYRVGVDSMPALRALQDHAARFHDTLQNAIDPHGILAPGRYR